MDSVATYLSCAQWFLFLTFACSLAGKATDFGSFVTTIRAILATPIPVARSLAALILAAEAGVVVLSMAGRDFLLIGFLAGTALLVAFSAVLAVTLARKQAIVCTCFGRGRDAVSVYDIARNVLMLAILIPAATFAPDPVPIFALFSAQQVIAALTAAVSLVVVLHVRDVATVLFTRPVTRKGREQE